MSKMKIKGATLNRIQEAMKDADGHRETVLVIYANHITKRFQTGVVGNPEVLHSIWVHMIDQCEKGIADQPTKTAMLTLFTALALYYEPDELNKKMAGIRAEIEAIANKGKN